MLYKARGEGYCSFLPSNPLSDLARYYHTGSAITPCLLEHFCRYHCSGFSKRRRTHILNFWFRQAHLSLFLFATHSICPLLWSAQTGSWESNWSPSPWPHQIHPQEQQSGTRAELPEFFCTLRSLLQHQLLQHGDRNSPHQSLLISETTHWSIMRSYSVIEKTLSWQSPPAKEQGELCPLSLLPEQQDFSALYPLKSHHCSSTPRRLKEPRQDRKSVV